MTDNLLAQNILHVLHYPGEIKTEDLLENLPSGRQVFSVSSVLESDLFKSNNFKNKYNAKGIPNNVQIS